MVVDTGRPSQKAQRSRKGKKAWRKNIDLDGFEQNLDEERDAEIALGPQQALFTIDKKADEEGLSKAMKSEKRLKAHEILNARSAVPALSAMHKQKDKPKSKPQRSVEELRKAAGLTEESKDKIDIEREGVLRTGKLGDLWDDDSAPPAPIAKKPVINKPVTKPVTKPIVKRRAPDAPLPGTIPVEVAMAGQSYNPALDAWRQTVVEAHRSAEKQEDRQRQLDEEKARINAIIAETEAKIAHDEEHGEPGSEESESESDGAEKVIGKLSVNPPAEMKRKTRKQRNRERRHQQWKQDLELLREKKRVLRQIANPQPQPQQPKKQKRELDPDEPRRAHSKATVIEAPMAVKLSDELDDSLRRLKPEGNLMIERVRSLQARGIIDAPVEERKRKPKVRNVERWSFKDFI